ncbi:MAG: helix-turn-helix transcriptional regulator [Roseibium sp.]|uniref:helix-turn-helix domain-containing protein n=1 Tax=Roseibium sp. TaxID=1936156 RepID=UPI001B2983C9|nr:helix-turn-helix transcriptional regulator [Roseibium sp.]MBO6893417.1 helix-turn-helix transcriptional regulator [Roseibium sp.]MBO6930616.1 helix-turn-helix transcriptional regulator [Roseibium sp.]
MHPLEEYRKENKLKMQELSKKLGCGLSVYKSWIYGWRYPSVKNLRRIEVKTSVKPDQLWEAYKRLQKNLEAAE